MLRGGQIGAAPGNLPASITHTKAATSSSGFPIDARQSLKKIDEEAIQSYGMDLEEMYGKN